MTFSITSGGKNPVSSYYLAQSILCRASTIVVNSTVTPHKKQKLGRFYHIKDAVDIGEKTTGVMLGVIYPNNVMAISGEQMTNVLAFDGALVGSEGWIGKGNLVDSTLPPVGLDISGSGSTSNTPSASFLARNNGILSFVVSGGGGNYGIQESINDQDRTNIVRLGVSAGFGIVKIKKGYYYRGICDKQSGVEIIGSPVSLIYSI